jgi:AcrR family transcriptional regulator
MAGRRRGEELEATILDAAWAEIQEHGYRKLTMEGVAARARTGKQVIYRRWPNRAQLTVAAVRHVLGPMVAEVPDTGDLREDLLAMLRLMSARIQHYNPELLYGMLAEVPDLDDNMFTILPQVVRTILEQAVARGELTHADLPPRALSLPADLMRYESLRHIRRWKETDPAATEKLIAEIVDDVFLPLVTGLAGQTSRGVDPN